MLQDAHTRKVSIPVSAPIGTTTIIASVPNTWLYVHDLVGDLDAAGTIAIYAGSRKLAAFSLAAGQGFSLSDEPGEDNRPRFECKPGENFIITTVGGNFIGSAHYSLRY